MDNKNDNRKIASKSKYNNISEKQKQKLSLKVTEKDNGLNHLPSIKLELHRIERKILTRAGICLLNELDIQILGNSKKQPIYIEDQKKKNEKETENVIVSPMGRDEFHQILKNGWGLDNQIVSPIKEQDFKDFIRNSLAPVLEEQNMNTVPIPIEIMKPNASRKSAPPPVTRKLFTATPRKKSTPVKTDMSTPSISKYLPKMELTPQIGEGPLENRASRLRKMKMDGMKMSGSRKDLDFSF